MERISTSVGAVGLVALVLGASLVGAGVVFAGTGEGPQATQLADGNEATRGQTITVSASGDAKAEPDRAVVRVSVEATAADPTVARQRVAQNVSSMRQALVDLGLAEDAIQTTRFTIYEDRAKRPQAAVESGAASTDRASAAASTVRASGSAPPAGSEPKTSYRASHSFVIDVNDTARVGTVIDTAVDNGATSVHGVEFTLSEETRKDLRQTAIEEAMTDARNQADILAATAGLTITDVHAAQTGAVGGPRPVTMAAASAGSAGGEGTAIESGPVTVTATVSVTYNASG